MHLNHQRRFQYNIHPRGSEDVEPYYPPPPSRNPRDYSLHEVSPIRNRHSLEQPSYQEAHRYNSMHADDSLFYPVAPPQDQLYEPRRRTASTTGFRKTQDKVRRMGDDAPPQATRKGRMRGQGDNFGAEFDGINIRRNSPRERHGRGLQENVNHVNVRGSPGRKTKKIEHVTEPPLRDEPNEKEILDKISRINRLNDEINGRLQRMLSKMQDLE